MNGSVRRPWRLASTALFLALGLPAAADETPVATPPAAIVQSEPRFDVEVDGAPARAFFSGLATDMPYNILVSPEVSGKISLSLKRVTIGEVLDAVRELYGYDYRRVSTGYLILPATIQTRVFHLNYLDLQRSGVSQTRISSGQITQNNGSQYGGGGGGSGSGSNNGSNGNNGSDQGDEQQSSKDVSGTAVVTRNDSNFWTGIEADVRALVGSAAGNSVVINRQSGVIVARGMPSELRDVADYLSKTQQTVTRQVILEAKIVEVALNDSYQAGINWSAVFTRGGDQYFVGQAAPQGFDSGQLVGPSGPINVSPGNPISGFVNNTLGGAFTLAADLTDFNAFIDLLSTQGQTRVLSSPRVATLHNQKAVIKAGTDEFFVTGVQSDTVTGTASTTNVNFELTPFFSGVALDVTPQISEDGRVLLHIHPAVSDVNNQTKMLTVRGQTDTLPLALSQIRESDSIVSARSGQVIVIGGLMRETRDRQQFKTPLLGDIPGVGRLFRSEREKKLTSELVILLRPMVVNDNDWPTLVSGPSERIEKMTKKNKLK